MRGSLWERKPRKEGVVVGFGSSEGKMVLTQDRQEGGRTRGGHVFFLSDDAEKYRIEAIHIAEDLSMGKQRGGGK